jgi:6-phosphogluconate dehydrogenase
MRLGMIGLGKMGLNMSRRLINNGHEIFAYDALSSTREVAISYGIKTFESIASMTESLGPKKIVWLMLPDTIVEQVCNELKLLLTKEDIVIDGGNCHFEESIKKFNSFSTMGIEFMDVGVSGGVFGLDRGYCLMIGGNKHTFDYLKPIFKSLSPFWQCYRRIFILW